MYESGGPGIIGIKQPNKPTTKRIAHMMISKLVMVQKYELTLGKINEKKGYLV